MQKSLAKTYLAEMIKLLQGLDTRPVDQLIGLLHTAYDEDRQIFIFGNGGSGATASHITCDINKGVSFGKEKRFRVICLNDNIPTLTAYANDVHFHDIFVEPLKNFLRAGDVVIGISGSGNSENVIRAIEYANQKKARTVGICGYSGGRLKQAAQLAVHVEVQDMQKSEDVHHMIGHIVMQALHRRASSIV